MLRPDFNASALAPLLDGSSAGELIPELARHGLQQLIELEVAAVLGAERHECTDERLGYRNGSRRRRGCERNRRPGNAASVVFNAAGNRAYVVLHNQTGLSRVTALNTTDQGNPTIIGTGSPVPATGSGNLSYGALDMVITPDGNYGIVSNGWNNSVTVMSLALIESSSNSAGVRTIGLGTATRAPQAGTDAPSAGQDSYGPIGMTIPGSMVYIANQWENTVTALDISNGNPANWGTSVFITATTDGLDNPTWIMSGTVGGTTKLFVSSAIESGLVQYRTL